MTRRPASRRDTLGDGDCRSCATARPRRRDRPRRVAGKPRTSTGAPSRRGRPIELGRDRLAVLLDREGSRRAARGHAPDEPHLVLGRARAGERPCRRDGDLAHTLPEGGRCGDDGLTPVSHPEPRPRPRVGRGFEDTAQPHARAWPRRPLTRRRRRRHVHVELEPRRGHAQERAGLLRGDHGAHAPLDAHPARPAGRPTARAESCRGARPARGRDLGCPRPHAVAAPRAAGHGPAGTRAGARSRRARRRAASPRRRRGRPRTTWRIRRPRRRSGPAPQGEDGSRATKGRPGMDLRARAGERQGFYIDSVRGRLLLSAQHGGN